MNIKRTLFELEENGLNIFLSIKVSDLPDDIYPFTNEQKEKTLGLIGNGGKKLWEKIPFPRDPSNHTIDQFTKSCMEKIRHDLDDEDMEILFPNDKIILPLQRISRHMNLSHQSPMGIDISSEFGLWFAIRGVFLTKKEIPLINRESFSSPCHECIEQFCTKDSDLSTNRLNCPVKTEHQYSKEQRLYHQSAISILKV